MSIIKPCKMSSKSVEEIFRLIEKHGKSNYIGEPVTIVEHMIQCAMRAEDNAYPTKGMVGDCYYLIQSTGQGYHLSLGEITLEEELLEGKVILGAFFHDIGHLVGLDGQASLMSTDGQILGTKDHEVVGANYLTQFGLDSQISDIVLHHVDAKRYLVYKNPLYFEGLSKASKETLAHQGGPMSASEAEKFEKSSLFNLILKIREWDEQSKETSKILKPLSFYEKMCREYLGQ